MDLTDATAVLTAVWAQLDSLGIMPFVFAGAIIALVGLAYKKIRAAVR